MKGSLNGPIIRASAAHGRVGSYPTCPGLTEGLSYISTGLTSMDGGKRLASYRLCTDRSERIPSVVISTQREREGNMRVGDMVDR